MAIPRVPTIDFSSILKEGDEAGKKKVIGEVGRACLEFGFFQIVNHGLPLNLVEHALELSKTFFQYPIEEKLKCKPQSTNFPTGYGRMDSFFGSNEWLMVRLPELGFNVSPDNPPEIREKLEEIFQEIQKLALNVESMINEYLGLPIGFLGEYNDDRTTDTLIAWHYPPATDNINKLGRREHQDGDMVTFLFQDEVGGLEVEIDGKWIPIVPVEGAIVVNVGVVLQVLTNKRIMAARHRVLKNSERSRQSIVYFYTIGRDKWVEPLPQFTREIGEAPKYRGFIYRELSQKRLDQAKNVSDKSQDLAEIDGYEIKNSCHG